MKKEVAFVLNRFPTYQGRILEEYTNNEEFRSLCEDIYSSARTLEQRQRQLMIDSRRELEYRKLFHDLEDELVKFLNVKDIEHARFPATKSSADQQISRNPELPEE